MLGLGLGLGLGRGFGEGRSLGLGLGLLAHHLGQQRRRVALLKQKSQ